MPGHGGLNEALRGEARALQQGKALVFWSQTMSRVDGAPARAGDEICIGGGGGGRGPSSLAGVRRVRGVLEGYRCVLDSARKLTGRGSRDSPVSRCRRFLSRVGTHSAVHPGAEPRCLVAVDVIPRLAECPEVGRGVSQLLGHGSRFPGSITVGRCAETLPRDEVPLDEVEESELLNLERVGPSYELVA